MDSTSDPLGLDEAWSSTRPEPSGSSRGDVATSTSPSSDEPPLEAYVGYDDPGYFDDGDPGPSFDDSHYDDYDAGPFDGPAYEPAGEFGSSSSAGRPDRPLRAFGGPRRNVQNAGPAGEPDAVLEAIRNVLAALHNAPVDDIMSTVGALQQESEMLDRLDDERRLTIRGVLEALMVECSDVDGAGKVDFTYVPWAGNHRSEVRKEFELLKARAESGVELPNPRSHLAATVAAIRDGVELEAAEAYKAAILGKLPGDEREKAFKSLRGPLTQRSESQENSYTRSLREWVDDHEAIEASGQGHRPLSSGLPTLDATTNGDGFILPGEYWIIGAGTGHGKSAFTRPLVTALAEDLVNGYGRNHQKVIVGITEEEPYTVAQAMKAGPGQPYHHLADNIIITRVNSSRARLVEAVFDCVADGIRRSNETGLPVTEFLPAVCILDYIQACGEEGEDGNTGAVDRTGDMMKGICEWDLRTMEQTSGVSFSAYTGLEWPSGISHHRVGVVVLSQLRQEPNDAYYKPGKGDLSRYVMLHPDGRPMWEVREGDYYLPDRADLRGSAKFLQHGTGILVLHRSNPLAPLVKDPTDPTGKRMRMSDPRARILVRKARNAARLPYVMLRFDSNPEGFRGQFYDDRGHQAVEQGRRKIAPSYRRQGDPMLPLRERTVVTTDVRY